MLLDFYSIEREVMLSIWSDRCLGRLVRICSVSEGGVCVCNFWLFF